jgi:hypothetical protein
MSERKLVDPASEETVNLLTGALRENARLIKSIEAELVRQLGLIDRLERAEAEVAELRARLARLEN